MFNFVYYSSLHGHPWYYVQIGDNKNSCLGEISKHYERDEYGFTPYYDTGELSIDELREIANFMEERWKTKFRVGDEVIVTGYSGYEDLRGFKGTILCLYDDMCEIDLKDYGTLPLPLKVLDYKELYELIPSIVIS